MNETMNVALHSPPRIQNLLWSSPYLLQPGLLINISHRYTVPHIKNPAFCLVKTQQSAAELMTWVTIIYSSYPYYLALLAF